MSMGVVSIVVVLLLVFLPMLTVYFIKNEKRKKVDN